MCNNNKNHVFFLLCVLTVIIFPTTKSGDICSETANSAVNDIYARNLNRLLFDLASNTTKRDTYYSPSSGEDPDKVYGLGLCRGNFVAEECSRCLNSTSEDLNTNCAEAFSWGDRCMIRYSKLNFYGTIKFDPPSPHILYNAGDLNTNLTLFDQIWEKLIGDLVRRVAVGRYNYLTNKAELSSFETIYALTECVPGLSLSDCDSCLRESAAEYQQCCRGKRGGVVQKPSCYFRWELYPFYSYPSLALPPDYGYDSPPPPDYGYAYPPPPGPTHTTTLEEKRGIDTRTLVIIIVISILVFMAIVAITCALFQKRWKPKQGIEDQQEDSQEVQLLELGGGNFGNDFLGKDFQGERMGTSQEFPSIQLDIINAATKHFCDENKLGEGGFGPVYKGTLPDGKEIAVKRLSRSSHQGLLEFKNEVMLIARLQHKNLVRLMGCCLENSENLLVYEYMPNRSLDFFLFDSSMSVQLDWQKRFSIIIGIARGIMYLHEDSRLKIIHRDLKASNILLDGEMNPKISDFGMARIFGGNQSEANTNRVVGTYGYMAPEYAMEGLFSIKSDVFSFGVLLLEIISGKKNNGFHLYKCGESLLTFAWKLWSTNQGMELIDPILVQSCVASEVLKCLHIGLLCVQEDPANRPTMSFVIVMLGSDTITLPKPTEPAFSSVGRVVVEQAILPLNDILCSVNQVTLSNVSPR